MQEMSYELTLNAPSAHNVMNAMHENTVRVILNECSNFAKANELDSKRAMHLRLLTEEMLSMLPNLMDYGSGKFYIENKDDMIQIHLELFLKESAVKAAIAKRAAEAKANAGKGTVGMLKRIAAAVDSAALKMGVVKKEESSWSLSEYIESVRSTDREKNLEAWDELEHSVIANIADDVIVTSTVDSVNITICKDMVSNEKFQNNIEEE